MKVRSVRSEDPWTCEDPWISIDEYNYMASICFLCNALVSRCVAIGFRTLIEIGQTQVICDS